MKKAEVKILQEDKQKIEENLVLEKRKVYVPKELRVEIIQLYHNILVAEYRGRQIMMELVTRNIERYVEGYNICQRMKNKTKTLVGKLKLNKILEKSWIYLIVNFMTKLLVVAKKDVILVVCDRLSKITYFVATIKRILAKGLAKLLKDNMQKLHKFPESVVLDRRPQFVVELTKDLNKILGIEMQLSISFHSQTDSQIERMNQELEQYLKFFINHR